MDKPTKPKPKPSADTSRLEAMVRAIIANPNNFPKLTPSAITATAQLILDEIDKINGQR